LRITNLVDFDDADIESEAQKPEERQRESCMSDRHTMQEVPRVSVKPANGPAPEEDLDLVGEELTHGHQSGESDEDHGKGT